MSELSKRDLRIIARDEKILRREQSIRNSRMGALMLSLGMIFFPILFDDAEDLIRATEDIHMVVTTFWCCVAVYYQAVCYHIDSIKLYRREHV